MKKAVDKPRLVVIGNGMAGIRFLEELARQEHCPYSVTVFGSEPHGGYNRILLTPLLSGEQTLDDVITHNQDWYAQHGYQLYSDHTITHIDREQKFIKDDKGQTHEYDKLLIATGSTPFVPPIPGHDLQGVHTYRTIEDVETILEKSRNGGNAIVIGGGLLGLEAAWGLKTRGMNVTVLHLAAELMNNQLDTVAATQLQGSLQQRGITIFTQVNTRRLLGEESIKAVELDNGTLLDADLVIIAVGIRANCQLAESAGLECERGILVDDHLQTTDKHIFSLGECVQHRQTTYGLVAPLYEQAKTCAEYLCGDADAEYIGSLTATGLKVTGIHLFSAGQFLEDEDCKTITLHDVSNGIYRKLVVKENRLIGALLYGDITGSLWYQQLIREATDITAFREALMFGPDFIAESMSAPVATMAA